MQIAQNDPLPSWNDTEMKAKIIHFVDSIVPGIPVADRLAVFDMDGTIACEEPLWLEMYCAVQGLCQQVEKDSSLLQQTMYQYAEKLRVNPKDTSVTNNYGPLIDTMIHSAFKGWDNEAYIQFCKSYLSTASNPDYPVILDETFYPPMLEVLEYLQANDFEIYIVSGSMQGLLWSVCPKAIGFDRSHLIGTRQQMIPKYVANQSTAFILQAETWEPGNNNDGKAENIYSHIGKTPILAFGNTTGDFGMFRFTSTNILPHFSFLINHDDSLREYKYEPWHGQGMPAWCDTMNLYGWNIVDMSSNFELVFAE
jgi:phosphoserine phosphatase